MSFSKKLKSALGSEKNTSLEYPVPNTNATLKYREIQSKKSDKLYIVIDGYSGDVESLRIPKIIDGKLVLYIHQGAFAKKTGLMEVVLPEGLKVLKSDVFTECRDLKKVVFPPKIEEIEENALRGCGNLKYARLPKSIKKIAYNAFESTTELWCYEETVSVLGENTTLNIKPLNSNDIVDSSAMIPRKEDEETKVFYEESRLAEAICCHDYDASPYDDFMMPKRKNLGKNSRFSFQNGIYSNQGNQDKKGEKSKIILMGNISENTKIDGVEDVFEHVSKKLHEADLVIGNCGSQFFEKDTTIEQLNLGGFDLITHAHDELKVATIDQTLFALDRLNRGQLIHDGLYGSDKDNKWTHININGIHLAVFSYGDGHEVLDFTNAKENGAEFNIVYMCCEDNEEVTCAQMLADAGADYIVGCNSSKIKPYNVLVTRDNRHVPVIYSAGNIFDNDEAAVIYELNLYKTAEGKVKIESEGYHPCMMLDKPVLIDEAMRSRDIEDRIKLEEGFFQVQTKIGLNSRLNCYADVDQILNVRLAEVQTDEEESWGVVSNLVSKKKQTQGDEEKNPYKFDQQNNCYYRKHNEGEAEAAILCTGLIEYDRKIEEDAEAFGSYEFMKGLKPIAACFNDEDLIIGSIGTMASEEYPSLGDISFEAGEKGYRNCRTEFIKSLKKAGFSALAAANPYNMALGVGGVLDTEKTLKNNKLISAGIGNDKCPVININGIKIGIVSVTAECINQNYRITGEGADELLSIYDAVKTKSLIDDAKEKGAEFVIAYVYCTNNKRPMILERRKSMAEEIAELGADYVICTGTRLLSPYYRYSTKDDRQVPIASSIGSFNSIKNAEENSAGALIKVLIRRCFDGSLDLVDSFIPINADETNAIATALGDEIHIEHDGIIKNSDPYTNTLTIEEIYQCLGKKPSEADLQSFGEKYHKPVSCVAFRKRFMVEDGVAIMFKYEEFVESTELEWDISECVEARISLVIDNVHHDELPCIVVDEPLVEVYAKLAKAVKDRYNPITVAITGSMGKTTTKEMAAKVFETNYRTFVIEGNINSIYGVGRFVQKLEDKHEAYIQEVHGGTPKSAGYISEVISPNICIVTNVVKNHMSQVGTIENLIKNKLDVAKGLAEDGVVILCNDNEYLQKAELLHKTIRYSIHDDSCHYYAKNIVVKEECITFDIVSNKSQFDDAGVYPAILNLKGKHNVSNALAVFAAARQAGIPHHRIIAGLAGYRATGIRQNVFDHGGITFMLDTYNSNPRALMAMMDVFDQTPPKEGGKKVLVIGMMGEQGDDSPQVHYDAGKALCDYDFDMMFCFGEDAKYMVKAVKECGKEAYYFDDRATFNKMISLNVKPGDVVLVKGSRSIELDTDTLVPIYGRTIRQN